ncbi:MAG: FHA domain-containing protein, partial [Lysobacterales bacterium]
MQILIRRVQRDRKGNEALFETAIAGSRLSVGHQNDQNLQLLDPEIAALHAVLSAGRGGRFALRCIGAARVRLDGKSVARANLRPGNRVEIGRQTLTVVPPPAGFGAALEVLAVAQSEEYGPTTHFVIDLDRTGLR